MSNIKINRSSISECNQEGVKRMKIRKLKNGMGFALVTPIVLALFLILMVCVASSARVLAAQAETQGKLPEQPSGQAHYGSPEEAMRALVNAAQAKDRAALAEIFGAEHQAEMFSGDQVQDNEEMDEFAADVQESEKL